MKYGFIIEGVNDEDKLLTVLPDAICVVTKGTRIDNRIKSEVTNMLNLCDEVFLLLDPDEAGDRLEQMLLKCFPSMRRVKLDSKQCLCYRNHRVKVGVEHCSNSYLKEALTEYVNF